MPRSKKVPEQVPVVIEVITETTSKPAKEVKPVAKGIEANEARKQAKEVKPVKPVKKKTAYTAYISQRYAELKASGIDSKEIFKELAVIWGSMTAEQKSAFKAS